MSEQRDIINRATYKRFKGYNREEVNDWLQAFATYYYNLGLRDSVAAEVTAMRDELDWNNDQIAIIIIRRNEVVDAINGKYINADEILEGLIAEGLKIKDYIMRKPYEEVKHEKDKGDSQKA